MNQADRIERARRNALWVFGFASLTALSLGAVVMAHVEGIFGLAWSQSPGLAIIMGVSLAVAALSPLIVWAAHPMGLIAPFALAVYLAATAKAGLFGAYPVPVAGYDLSFVVGWWLGISALCVRRAG